jgi:hypothetical protein
VGLPPSVALVSGLEHLSADESLLLVFAVRAMLRLKPLLRRSP